MSSPRSIRRLVLAVVLGAPATLSAQAGQYHVTADRARPRAPVIPGSFTILVLER